MQEIRYDEEEYPQKLKSYKKAPQVLYCEGNISLLNRKKAVAIVGTRYPSEFSTKQTYELAGNLASKNIVVVSGGAIGTDYEAHLGALDAYGFTIAVLGSTLSNKYPKENKYLFDRIIAEDGLVVTEYNEDKYEPWRFPERDVLIALLAKTVIPMQLSKTIKKNGKISYGGTMNAVNAAKVYERGLYVPIPNADDAELYPDKYEGIYTLIESGANTFTQGNYSNIISQL